MTNICIGNESSEIATKIKFSTPVQTGPTTVKSGSFALRKANTTIQIVEEVKVKRPSPQQSRTDGASKVSKMNKSKVSLQINKRKALSKWSQGGSNSPELRKSITKKPAVRFVAKNILPDDFFEKEKSRSSSPRDSRTLSMAAGNNRNRSAEISKKILMNLKASTYLKDLYENCPVFDELPFTFAAVETAGWHQISKYIKRPETDTTNKQKQLFS